MNYSLGILYVLICLCSIIWLGKMFGSEFRIQKLRKKIDKLLPDAVFILGIPWRVLAYNHYSREKYPFFSEEAVSSNLWDWLPTEFVARIYKGYKDAVDTNKKQTTQFSFVWERKRMIELEVRFIPLPDDKYILCIVKIIREVRIR